MPPCGRSADNSIAVVGLRCVFTLLWSTPYGWATVQRVQDVATGALMRERIVATIGWRTAVPLWVALMSADRRSARLLRDVSIALFSHRHSAVSVVACGCGSLPMAIL